MRSKYHGKFVELSAADDLSVAMHLPCTCGHELRQHDYTYAPVPYPFGGASGSRFITTSHCLIMGCKCLNQFNLAEDLE